MKINLTHIETLGHGYLKVNLYDLKGWGFETKSDFSSFSFIDLNTHNVYLEEDRDATKFINTMESKGHEINIISDYRPNFNPRDTFYILDCVA
tara:strand:- start:497 stop:775 length:279 start_codon:yes stop_codon:yes gene_type:complete